MPSSSGSPRPKIRIEPLGPQHDRAVFASGNSYIDTQVRHALLDLQRVNLTRAYVAVAPGAPQVIGVYAFNSHMIQAWDAPPEWDRLIQRHTLEGIPAAYISCFATHGPFQRRGIGRALMADALRRIKAAATAGPAVFAVVLDPIDAEAERFYARLGFVGLPDKRRRMIYPVSAIG